MNQETPEIGDQIVYIDEHRQPHHAVIARVYTDEAWAAGGKRPRVCLAWLGYDGMYKKVLHCEPAYHDGERWIVLHKWAYKGEIPDEEIEKPGSHL